MTLEEYAKRYGLRPSKLRDLLKKGRVRGARCVDGVWEIPKNAMVEYYARPKNCRTIQDVVWDITRAANLSQYFDGEVLQATSTQFSTALDITIRLGYIVREETPGDGITSSGYAITAEGMRACEKNKKDFLGNLANMIGSMAGSAAGSFYAAAL